MVRLRNRIQSTTGTGVDSSDVQASVTLFLWTELPVTAMPTVRLPALQTAREPMRDRPMPLLPSPPSPTLTNPDLVLPNAVPDFSSPPRANQRPPSPTYLRETSGERPTSSGTMGRKEKFNSMSRKVMLLKTRHSSGGSNNNHRNAQDYDSGRPYTPILQDVGNLAPERTELPGLSNGESSSSDGSSTTGIATKNAKPEDDNDNDLDDGGNGSLTPTYKTSVAIEDEIDVHRRKQEEEEYNSAILSKRAEEILANAKKRLNMMEGNLRGARDLVLPLTAANLKRATSVSGHYSPALSRASAVPHTYTYDNGTQQSSRQLSGQASSPYLGRGFQAHSRGFSDVELPERPYTALDHAPIGMLRNARIPVKPNEPSWTRSLRGSRSYDSIGGNAVTRDRPSYNRGSPEGGLEPLHEDEETRKPPPGPPAPSVASGITDGLGIHRPSSRASDLRDQMSSLKSKISNLKERAREDSLRRQSLQSLRTASPFNNAVLNGPEFYYNSSSDGGSQGLEANDGGDGHGSQKSPIDQARQEGLEDETALHQDSTSDHLNEAGAQGGTPYRGAHRHNNSSQEISRAEVENNDLPIVPAGREGLTEHALNTVESKTPLDAHDPSAEDEPSVFEDTDPDQAPVLAHEDREDAFDYEHFFLLSSMARYKTDRRGSDSSEGTVSTNGTARAPAGVGDDEAFNADEDPFLPSGPSTPERLKDIERNLYKRTLSTESASTIATFVTADEDSGDGEEDSHIPDEMNWPFQLHTEINHRPIHRSSGSALKRPQRRNSSSERADSGLGLPRRSNSSRSSRRAPPGSLTPKLTVGTSNGAAISSPSMSPDRVHLHDPTTVAVNALLDPEGKPLGLRDKAALFSLVESLRKVVRIIQEEDESLSESRVLRRKLEAAKQTLDE